MFEKVLAVSVPAVLLAGCGFLQPDVGCNETSTQDLVKQILQQEIEKKFNDPRVQVAYQAVAGQLAITVDSIRTEAQDEKINKHTCKADLSVSLPAEAVSAFNGNPLISALIEQEGMSMTPGGIKAPIQYTSQAADGGKNHYVEVSGHVPLAEAVSLAAIMGAFKPAASASAATASAVVEAAPEVPAAAVRASDGPSFDCAKAGNDVERMICATPAVASLDKRLADTYKEYLKMSEDKGATKKEQAAWIKKTRNACKTADCLATAYQARIDDLEATISYLSKPAEFR